MATAVSCHELMTTPSTGGKFRTATGRPLRILPGSRLAPCAVKRAPHAAPDILEAISAARGRHVYVLGQPGAGKSTLLHHLIDDDLRAGRGALVLDPHGTLCQAVVEAAPRTPASSILLVDPGDTQYPFGLNILEALEPEAQDRVVQFVIDLFMTLYLPDQQGPMLHQAIRNGLRLLMATDRLLPELPMLFTDKPYLRKLLERVRDPWVVHYFEKVWLPWSTDKEGSLSYLTSKLSHFVEDRILRNILGQTQGLDLAAALERRAVVLVNLSPARVGSLNRRLLGMLLLHKVDQLMRGRTASAPPNHVYVDELHEVVTPGFQAMLASARKFGIGFVLAHQGLEQLPSSIDVPLVESVGTLVAFRHGPGPGAELLAEALWSRFTARDLLTLPDYQAVARVVGSQGKPQAGRLRPGPPLPRLGESIDAILDASRRAIARPRDEVEAELLARLQARAE